MDAAERAVAIAPDLADGLAARAFLRAATRWDWSGAVADVERAVALNPGRAATCEVAAWVYEPAGRVDDSVAAARRATDLDPLSALAWARYGRLLYETDRLDEAKVALERSLQVLPDQNYAGTDLAIVLLVQGRARDALELADRIRIDGCRLQVQSMALHTLGDEAGSERALQEAARLYGENTAFQIAEGYAWRGDRDRAFAWLGRAIAQRDAGIAHLAGRPTLRSLHGDPRFAAMLQKIGIPPQSASGR